MTEDTKRALEAITPMAKQLSIEVTADDHFLYCNGQAIGIGCNSAYATIKEFVGYVFATVYKHDVFDLHGEAIPSKILDRVKKYWFTKDQLAKFREAEGK
ncbi:MAG: hypothetical protein IKM73_08680 [Acidaminococcaceae bacterium]|nr:hypothetical protein [Acidaminococcaceae bacterium]